MNLPKVLIIGAMKAGTTSLYIDLTSHPGVYLANDKEPHALCSDDVFSEQGLRRYADNYKQAQADQICLDASTGYSKRPDFEGVSERAMKILPDGFRVIYLVRNPIKRIISQHHHEYFERLVAADVNEVVLKEPRYVQYSRYFYQVKPWLDAIGRDRVLIVPFEDYTERRFETLSRICRFIELPLDGCAVDEHAVYNKSEGKPVRTAAWARLQHNSLYRRLLRPFTTPGARRAIRQILLPKANERLPSLSPECRAELARKLHDDVQDLKSLLSPDVPNWTEF